jgi:crotonobetainyl-CoA:carnitine CoA-transferase CaiB-like acyl-CoA transferase
MAKFGFDDERLLGANPGLIVSHVRLYGTTGPWAAKAGFDMQGSASSGMMALCGEGVGRPRWPPGMVINDYTTGYFGALAIQAAVLRRMREGGGYVLSPSLCKTAMTIVKHFQTALEPALALSTENALLPPDELELRTGVGLLRTLKPLPVLSRTPICYGPTTLA